MREIIESDFFVRKRIDKKINWFGIWWLRLITKNFHTKLENNLKKSFSNEIKIKVKAFQYEWETYNFGQYYDIEIDNIGTINIWFGYDYSPEVNNNFKGNDSFYIAINMKNKFLLEEFYKIQRYARNENYCYLYKNKEQWHYKNIGKRLKVRKTLNEIKNVINRLVNKTKQGAN